MVEGALTAERIHENHRNMHAYFVDVMKADLREPMAW
jgi:hypothetical protein